MAKIYISGAITGCPDYKEKFEKAENELQKKGFSVINPAKVDDILKSNEFGYEDYMKVDIVLLDMCDCIYMLSGWENSKGANREYGYALGKGLDVMFEEV